MMISILANEQGDAVAAHPSRAVRRVLMENMIFLAPPAIFRRIPRKAPGVKVQAGKSARVLRLFVCHERLRRGAVERRRLGKSRSLESFFKFRTGASPARSAAAASNDTSKRQRADRI